MTTLLLIRHGQSLSNADGIFTGQLDLPLSPLGLLQAQKTAAFIARQYAVDRIYSSDLVRALATAQPLADRLGLSVIRTRGMREIYAGAWQGLPYAEIAQRYPNDFSRWRTDIGNAICTGGEAVAALCDRVWETVSAIAAENTDGTIAVVTHAIPIRALQCRVDGLPLAAMRDIPWVTNASVTVLTYEQGAFRMQAVSLDAHLQGVHTVLPDTV